MKQVYFESIKIQNFLSIGDEPVEINFKKGLNIITGINKDKVERQNAIGKSSIVDAIFFAIFGKTIRDIKKHHVINKFTNNSAYVELNFVVLTPTTKTQYTIVRTIKPTKCFLYINGEDKTESTIIKTTKYITDVLEATEEIFLNCVIMSLNYTIPFMAQSKVQKRKFIEGILNLQIFSEMLLMSRAEYNDVKNNYVLKRKDYEHVQQTLEIQNKHLKNHNQYVSDKIKSIDSKIINLKQDIEKNEKLIVTVNEEQFDVLHKKWEDCEQVIQKLNVKRDNLNTSIATLKGQIKHIDNILDKIDINNVKCPRCLRVITDNDKTHIQEEIDLLTNEKVKYESELNNFNKQKNDLNNNLKKLKEAKEKLNSKIEKLKTQLSNNKNYIHNISVYKNNIQTLIDEKKQLKSPTEHIDDIKSQIQKLTTDTVTLKNSVDELNESLVVLDYCKVLLSEEGIKTSIIKKIVNMLNNRLVHYLEKMDANCVCVFDEYFDEKIIDIKGNESTYFNFSGAERKNIDLACLFTFMDIRRMQGNVWYNLVMFDELLDSSLDHKGVELVIDILNERVDKMNESIYVISHRKESTKAATGEVVFLQKHNNITTRVSFEQ